MQISCGIFSPRYTWCPRSTWRARPPPPHYLTNSELILSWELSPVRFFFVCTLRQTSAKNKSSTIADSLVFWIKKRNFSKNLSQQRKLFLAKLHLHSFATFNISLNFAREVCKKAFPRGCTEWINGRAKRKSLLVRSRDFLELSDRAVIMSFCAWIPRCKRKARYLCTKNGEQYTLAKKRYSVIKRKREEQREERRRKKGRKERERDKDWLIKFYLLSALGKVSSSAT